MWWQTIVVVLAGLGFPTLALLYFIGGPNWRDQQGSKGPRGPRHAATERRGDSATDATTGATTGSQDRGI